MSQDMLKASFERWGLTDNPFVSLPPDRQEERQSVFTGRQQEVDQLMKLVERPRGIFLVGLFGVGKSILVLEVLRQLDEKGYITAYAKFDREFGFTKSALKKLAVACAQRQPQAVYELLTRGRDVKRKDVIELKDIDDAVYNVRSAMDAAAGLIQMFKRKRGTTAVVVMDDLDKGTEIGNINEIIFDTRQLIDLGCVVILPGHPFGSTAEFSSSADILNPLPLEPLSEDELVEMMGKYLNLARAGGRGPVEKTYPFSPGAARLIAKGIAEFKLTPRIFNFACQLLLDEAAGKGLDVIDRKFIASRWPAIAKNFLVSLKDVDKRRLKIIYDNSGFLSEDARKPIKQLGGDLAEYSEVRDILAKLIQENVLIEGVEEGKRRITPNPLLNKKKNFFIIR